MSTAELCHLIESENANTAGCASADLAQLIWDGAIDDAMLLSMLNDPKKTIRSAVAWAVSDCLRPQCGLAWLYEKGLHDSCANVRIFALRAADAQWAILPPEVKCRVADMANDNSEEVGERAVQVCDRKSA